MIETKKSLREAIKRKEEYIRHLEAVISLTEDSGLKKCNGLLCKGCAHAVWLSAPYSNGPIIIGCDIDVDCKDFARLPSTNGDYWRQT